MKLKPLKSLHLSGTKKVSNIYLIFISIINIISIIALNKKLAIELNNGRAAQMGILALMVHEKLDNNPYIINSLLGSPVPFN
jgi:hypothetical protein